MKTKFIYLNNVDEMALFVKKAESIGGPEVLCSRGRYIIDGKSLMGLISIEPSFGITVEYNNDAVEFDLFLNQFVK